MYHDIEETDVKCL